jgi:hypothetical protein
MADITRLSRLLNGVLRQVDISANTLVVSSIKVGGSVSNTELTKTILDNLISLQNGSDVSSSLHHHDGRYFTETELGSTSGTSGAERIGVKATPTNYSAGSANVEAHLAGIDSALATAGGTEFEDNTFRIVDEADDTKKIAFQASAITTGTVRTISMPDANVNLADVNNAVLVDGSRAFTADQSMGSNKLTDLANGTAAGDAVNKGQLDLYIPLTQKGANNGVATLDAGGKVPVSQLPSAVMTYEGVWNASTNTPELADGTGDAGMVYRVGTAGSQDLGSGSITTDAVASVNGQTGIVSLDTDDILEGATNLYYTQARFDSAFAAKDTDDLAEGSTNLYFTAARAQTAVISQVITDGVTNKAPSEDAVFDALAGKQDASANLDEADAFFGATDLSAAEAEQLSDGSNADSLHSHAIVKKTMVAGESFAANTSFLVRLAVNGETAGRVYKADKDASASDLFWAIGIAHSTGAVSAGGNISVVMLGSHTLGSSDAAFNASDIGKAVFLTAAGAFSITAPSAADEAVMKIGMVEATNKIWVEKQMMGIN